MVEVSNAAEFIENWNEMKDANEVMIFAHTNYHTILFEEGTNDNAISTNGMGFSGQELQGDFESLDAKNIKTLTINGCNSALIEGAYDETDGYNLQHAFFNNSNIDQVYAWDGSVSFGSLAGLGTYVGNYEARISHKQESIERWFDRLEVESREPVGLVVLEKNTAE
jgi:hypothetical protein